MIPLHFVNARETAGEVKEKARGAGLEQLSLLPYNRFQPEDTQWWLSPSTENPAYKYGKLMFEEPLPPKRAEQIGELFVGLYVEKGVGPAAKPVFAGSAHGRRTMMDESWVWHDFLTDLSTKTFKDAAGEAVHKARHSLLIGVEAMICPLPQDERGIHYEKSKIQPELAIFDYEGGELRFSKKCSRTRDLLRDLGSVDVLTDLADSILAIDELHWVWIDFYAGFPFRKARESESEWDAARIWSAACLPWIEWLR